MKTCYTIYLLVFLLLPHGILTAQPPGTNEDKAAQQHILRLEHQWLTAELKSDTVFISALLDSGFMGISEYGVHSRQEELVDMLNTMEQRKKNNVRIDTFEIKDGMVNLYGDAAVVTFVLHTFRNENGILTQRKTRFYDVWINKEGKWRAVSSQGCVVPD